VAITLHSAGTVTERTAETSTNVPYPASISAGDTLVLVGSVNTGGTTNITTPSGWTKLYGTSLSAGVVSPHMSVFITTAVGTETGSLAVAHSTGNSVSWWQMVAFTGIDTTTPQDVTQTTVDMGTAATNVPLPTLTPVTSGDCLFYAVAENATTNTNTPPTSPAAFTELGDRSTGTRTATTGYLIYNSTSATGTVNVVQNTSTRAIGVLIAFRPASTSSPASVSPPSGAATGDFTSPSIAASAVLAVAAAVAIAVGAVPGLVAGDVQGPPSAAATASQTNPAVAASAVIGVPAGVATGAATAPAITAGSSISASVSPPAGVATGAATAPALSVARNLAPPAGAAVGAATSPSLLAGRSVAIPAGAATAASTATALTAGASLAVPSGAALGAATAPHVGAAAAVTPPAGAATGSASAPNVGVAAAVAPPAGTATAASTAPAITVVTPRDVTAVAGPTITLWANSPGVTLINPGPTVSLVAAGPILEDT
jgi:hypothetical protein